MITPEEEIRDVNFKRKKLPTQIQVAMREKIESFEDLGEIKNYASYTLEEQLKDTINLMTTCTTTAERLIQLKNDLTEDLNTICKNSNILEKRKAELQRAIQLVK